MEFIKDPMPVRPDYIAYVEGALRTSRVTCGGLFKENGIFDVAKIIVRKTPITTTMWAWDLLRFIPEEDGVQSTKNGSLVVYHGRMMGNRPDRGSVAGTIEWSRVRFVDRAHSYTAKVGESGWVVSATAAFDQRKDRGISFRELEEILVNAEQGNSPPFFDNSTEYVKVEPGNEGSKIHVIKFTGGAGLVVVNEDRELVGKYTAPMLSRQRWEPQSVATRPLKSLFNF